MTKAERQQRYRERRRVRLASPSAVALAASQTPDDRLDPYTQAIRYRLTRYLEDAGGAAALAATKQAQIRSLVEAESILEPLSRDIETLAKGGNLWSLNTRRASPIMDSWIRLKEHRDKLLIAVGLDRHQAPAKDLGTIIREIEQGKAAKVPPTAAPQGTTPPVDPSSSSKSTQAGGTAVSQAPEREPAPLSPAHRQGGHDEPARAPEDVGQYPVMAEVFLSPARAPEDVGEF